MKKCPYCAEEIRDEAIFCKHCNNWLDKAGNFKSTNEILKVQVQCPHCGLLNSKRNRICYECRRDIWDPNDRSDPFKVNKWGKVKATILIIIFLAVGLILVPVLFPDVVNESPGHILLVGVFTIAIGIIAWMYSTTQNVEFVGGLGCCYFFPVFGFLLIIYGLIKLFFP